MTSLDLQSADGRYSVPHRLFTTFVPNLPWESALAWMTGITLLGWKLPSLYAVADNAPVWSFAGIIAGGLLLCLRAWIETNGRAVREQLRLEREQRRMYEAKLDRHNIPLEPTNE